MSTRYTPANQKPEKLLTGFISVRAPELKHIYSSLQGATSVSEVTSKFGRPSDTGLKTNHVEDTLRFLNAVDLVESPSGDILDTVELINDRHFGELPFEARLLYHCNQQDGRQSHFADIHRALLSEGSRTVDARRGNLRTILKRETDYDFSWTEEKIDMWVTLTEQLGLVTETEDGLVLSPCRALMYDALMLAPASLNDSPGYDDLSIDDGEAQQMLNWINDNLFTVYAGRTGTPKIHPAIADVLRNMAEDSVINLSAPGDSQNGVKLPPENLDDDDRGNRQDVTYVSISSKPSETAYQYPLNQFLTHQ
jgi:hypothetical protein